MNQHSPPSAYPHSHSHTARTQGAYDASGQATFYASYDEGSSGYNAGTSSSLAYPRYAAPDRHESNMSPYVNTDNLHSSACLSSHLHLHFIITNKN